MTLVERAYEEFKALPEEQARAVLDFIGYLRMKDERAEIHDLMLAQQETLKHIWDNAEDEVWNDL